jgi:hypothetical protein
VGVIDDNGVDLLETSRPRPVFSGFPHFLYSSNNCAYQREDAERED